MDENVTGTNTQLQQNGSGETNLLKSKKALVLIIVGIFIVSMASAFGIYKYLNRPDDKDMLIKIGTSISNRDNQLKQISNLINENAAADPGKTIDEVQSYFNYAVERDSRAVKILEEQEKAIEADKKTVEDLKALEVKQSVTAFLDEYKKYIDHLRVGFNKVKSTDERFQAMVSQIKDGKLNNSDATIKFKEIASSIDTNVTSIKEYDTLSIKNSYFSFLKLVQSKYPALNPVIPAEPFVITKLQLTPDKVDEIISGLLPSEQELTEAVIAAEDMINKVFNEAKKVKGKGQKYNPYTYVSETVDVFYLIPPTYANTPDAFSQYLRAKWDYRFADEMANYLFFSQDINAYTLGVDVTPPTYLNKTSKLKIEDRQINSARVRFVNNDMKKYPYIKFVDYDLKKTSEGWKVMSRNMNGYSGYPQGD